MSTAYQSTGVRILDDFVAKVRQKLAEKDMTISDLAARAKVGRPYLHRVLAGEQQPRIDWMEKVAKALGLKIKITS